jgi:His-Xaa-Ser system protein HxsD
MNNNSIDLVLNCKIYSLKAIKNAAYEFLNTAFITISEVSSDEIAINFSLKLTSEDLPSLVNKFKNSALDHQLRIDTENDYKVIREIIVAQAFEPCDNIKEIVSAIKS